MILYSETGNMFEYIINNPEAIITITVNMVGVMGKGLALDAKSRYPDIYEMYKKCLDNERLKLGKPAFVYSRRSQRYFVLFATKNHWRDPSQIEWVDNGLKNITTVLEEAHVPYRCQILLPKLGCGLGKLNWNDQVHPLMINHLTNSPYTFVIF